MCKDTIWNRPSWPLKGKPSKIMDQINELLNNDNNFFEKDSYYYGFYKNKLIDETLTAEQNNALKLLNLELPVNLGLLLEPQILKYCNFSGIYTFGQLFRQSTLLIN